MKKIVYVLLFIIILNNLSVTVSAQSLDGATATEDVETISLDDGYYIEVTLTVEDNRYTPYGISTFSAQSQTKSATKTYSIRNSSGTVLAQFKLHGSFSYVNGVSSTCTSATYSTNIYNSAWSFTYKSTTKSGNTANGSFTAVCKYNNEILTTVQKSISLKCDIYGNIS